jgi:hypothetical protein
MTWTAQRPAIEIAAEWIAATCVAGAMGFAGWALAPLGSGLPVAAAAAILGLSGARFVIGRSDRPHRPFGERFIPVDFTAEPNEPVTDDAAALDDALLLDDPLPALGADSRVVRLFAVPAVASDVTPLPAPGEMAARIEDFLGVTRPAPPASVAPPPAAADASAALHAALADIRRSLRHG